MNSNWLDLQHRAFQAYLKEVANIQDPDALSAQTRQAHFDAVLTDCTVNTDWIEQIENALPFIENAVRENRQFILRQGETVPIEKVRQVSRSSVEHLARHSELITRKPQEGDDLIPDHLHVTENIGTYAVYENRFLYMLLRYLQDFVELRHRKVSQLRSAFSSEIGLTQEIHSHTRSGQFELRHSERTTDMEGVQNPATEDALRRMMTIMQTTDLLLRTDLMKEVSAAPMLKPPITRTNVLLHDPNFQAAFELYSYLFAYNTDGFEQVERHRNSGRCTPELLSHLHALQNLASYLSYRHGGMEAELDRRFLEEEERRKATAEEEKKALLAALKQRIGDLEGPALSYMLALEQRNGQLEDKIAVLARRQDLQEQLQQELEAIQAENRTLGEKLRRAEDENRRLSHNNTQLQESNQRQQTDFDARQKALQAQHAATIAKLKQEYQTAYGALADELAQAQGKLRARDLAEGKEDPTEVFDTRESFSRLEAQYKAFTRYYKQQWTLAKKQLRRQLWKHPKK
jgi:predicted  nucleic acid-binding Zn-ribbon protein